MLTLRSVGYRYAGSSRWALRDVDLEVAGGDVVGIVGPNGAGKSTLCLVASGLAPASIGGELAGEVVLDGRPGGPATAAGIVFANPAAQLTGLHETVFEEVAFGPVNLGRPVDETVAATRAALAAVGIEALADRRPDRLSGGQTQLVAIASMLAKRPKALVLDEPVAELDPDGRRLVGEALRSLAAAGAAILVAEHDLDLLRAICTRLVAIDAGRLLFDLPIRAALEDPRLVELGVRGAAATAAPAPTVAPASGATS